MRLVSIFLAFLLLAACARQDHQRIGELEVSMTWSRETPPTATVAAGYATIRNTGSADDRLVSVESPGAARVEIHHVDMADGIMRMRKAIDGLSVPAGQTVVLAPGRSHLMFIDPVRQAVAGDELQATLVFERAGRLPVSFEVRSLSAQGVGTPPHH